MGQKKKKKKKKKRRQKKNDKGSITKGTLSAPLGTSSSMPCDEPGKSRHHGAPCPLCGAPAKAADQVHEKGKEEERRRRFRYRVQQQRERRQGAAPQAQVLDNDSLIIIETGNNYFFKKKYDEAIIQYKKVIEINSNYKNAYNNLGLCYKNIKKYAEAIIQFKKAIEIEYNYKNAYYNLGHCYLDIKKYEDAIIQFKRVIEIDSNYKNAYYNLGICYQLINKYDEAIIQYKKTIEIDSNYKEAYLNLGNSYQEINKNDEAIIQYKKAIEIDSNFKEAYENLGNSYRNIKKYEDAIIQYKKAIEIDSNYKEAYNNLGVCYQEINKNDEAIIQYKKVIEIDSNFKEAYMNLGNCYRDIKKYEDAIIQYKKAIEIDSNYKEGYLNLGNSYQEIKKYEDAIIQHKKLIEIDPNFKDVYYNMSFNYLANKDFKKGFELYENRFKINLKYFNLVDQIDLPLWTPWLHTDKKILIFVEQGLGDTFQFFRFIIPLKQKYPNTNFTFFCQYSKINHLFKSIIPIITPGSNINNYDYKLALMSIPHILELTHIKPYIGESYIKVNSDKLSFWKTKLSKLKNYKIGLCWKGANKKFEKYIPLELFQDISDLNVELISLQKGDGEKELDSIIFKNKIHHFEIDTEQSFIDTIAILKNIDLLITVDTSLVHLAGILGIKTWLILGFISDWRWGNKGKYTYWYNSVQIFRSNKIGYWSGVLDEIKHNLKIITDNSNINNQNLIIRI